MKLKLHHIELCVKDLNKTVQTLRDQFGFTIVGRRNTKQTEQIVLQTFTTTFVINSLKIHADENGNMAADDGLDTMEIQNHTTQKEPWTIFCCRNNNNNKKGKEGHHQLEHNNEEAHVDSVFNIAIEVENLTRCLEKLKSMQCKFLHEETTVSNENGFVTYAIVESCCGNVVHTLIQKSNYHGWFLPGGFNQEEVEVEVVAGIESNNTTELIKNNNNNTINILPTHFDHVALACHVGETNNIIKWYEEAFEMKRFLTNNQDSEENGLVIKGEVGMRLKVMEFWMCSEIGVESNKSESTKENLKIVVVESLANIRNTQIENFLAGHNGPGIQHIGLHTNNITKTVDHLIKSGVKFRHPPSTYYTEVGQLTAINSVGEDAQLLKEYGILLDTEADISAENENKEDSSQKYLMQIFTFPLFEQDTFFLEIIQRKGARGFGVGNVTALARSVNAYNEMMLLQQNSQKAMTAAMTMKTMITNSEIPKFSDQ